MYYKTPSTDNSVITQIILESTTRNH